MNNKIRFSVLLFLFFLNHLIYAQNIRHGDGITDFDFLIQTKSVDEFISRFNGNYDDVLINEISETYGFFDTTRSTIIQRLISKSLYIKNRTSLEAIDYFIKSAVDSSKSKLASLDNENSFAILDCTFKRDKINVSIKLSLLRKKVSENGYVWSIANILANNINLDNRKADSIYINPMSHGTDFMGIVRAFEDKNNFIEYTKHRNNSKYCFEQFIFEISTGVLEFNTIESISYCFFNVNDHIYYVSNNLPPCSPCGWIITEIDLKSEMNKKEIYNKFIYDCN